MSVRTAGWLGPATAALVALAACVDTGALTGGDPSGSSGTSGTTPGGTSDDIQLAPLRLELPATDCGAEAQKAFLILNRSKSMAEYEASSIDPAFVIASGARGTIAPGGTATIEVRATPNRLGATETALVVQVNGESRLLPAKVVGEGATFELSSSSLDLGDVRKENGGEAKITVRNGGSKALGATLEPVAPTADFEITPALINASPNGTAELTVRLKPGASTAAPVSASFKPKAAGICGSAPGLDVRGKRITTDVTIDTVDWGDVQCRAVPADRDATIRNYAPFPVTYTSALSGSAFTIVGSGSASLPGGSETNPSIQKITLKATSSTVPGQKEEALTISYGAGQSSTGKVRSNVVGLVLAIAPGSSTFSSDGTTEQRKTFNISNSAGKFGGSVSFNAGYQVTGGPGFRTENGTTTYQPAYLIFPPTTGTVDVVFKAAGPGAVSGNLVVTGPVCSQNTVALTGTNP